MLPRRFLTLLAVPVLALALAGCTDPDKSTTEPAPQDFCDAFTRLDDKLSEGNASQQDQYELVKEAVRLAPPEIKAFLPLLRDAGMLDR